MPASSYRFHPAAEVELREAADWYEDHSEGLGLEFLAKVRRKVIQILENPQLWREFRGTRRVLVGRFPYAIVYREVSADEIEIVAVAHFKKQPRYWSRR